jgi:hypothetical protein
MKSTRIGQRTLALAAVLGLAMLAAAPAAAPPGPTPLDPNRTILVISVMLALTVAGLVAILLINSALGKNNWSLANAVSEEVNLPLKDANGAVVMVNGVVVLAPTLVASTSRLIALYGLFAILLLYLGFGAFVLYDVGAGQPVPADLGKVQNFLVSGLTLFAPYLVNQFAGVFSGAATKG